ncbi:MAG: protein kinase [Acidobacteria bacterium]|nr:protein kinase [Acidobacteriota bacterium]
MESIEHQILIVDDDPGIGQMLSTYLARYGFHSDHVLDGPACFDALEKTNYDLVLLDLNMPEMDGFQVLTRIREQNSRLRLPIILVTGQSETDFVLRGFELGANDYITKPFVFSVVLARIRCQLSMHHLGIGKDMALLAAHVLEKGTVVGKYQILECVGRGGMGSVYRARDMKLGRDVALKTLLPTGELEQGVSERFRQEAKLIARVQHPGVVQIYEFSEVPISYFTMEYVEGKALSQIILERRVSVAEAVDITIAIGQALHAAHGEGIIHRDVKPSNVMVEPSGQIRLMDFGTAKMAASATRVTRTHDVVGTPCYMSPEQIDAHEEADIRTDVYALGVLFYELLAGHPPFTGSPIKVLWAAVHQAPESLAAFGVPQEVESICFKALAKNKMARFESAESFAAALMKVRAHFQSVSTIEGVRSQRT